jgi:hypothetical protein
MALSSTRLAAAIRTKLTGKAFWDDSAPGAAEFATAIAEALLEEITANAVVLPVLLVAPPGGGPVTGTGSIS